MNQTIYPWLDLYESAEACQIANLPIDPRSDRIFERQHHPRILLGLFHTERDLLLVRIDLEHDCFDGLTDRNQLRRMTHVARPTHLADMDQSLYSGFELNKCPVVRDRDHFASYACTNGVFFRYVLPRIALELFEAEADALARPVDVEHLDLELRTDGHKFRRMRDASPRHVRDVE